MRLAMIFVLFIFSLNSHAKVGTNEYGTVVSYHELATKAGQSLLSKGGNAFDAFVATTIAQYVLTEGVTSAAGPIGAVLFIAETKETLYLDGFYNNPADPSHIWQEGSPDGHAMVIPGAIRALESLSEKYGRLSFRTCLQPAIDLAQKGFEVNDLYSGLILKFAKVLKKTEYGRRTFFPNGKALEVGVTLKLPEVANFLSNISEFGSRYMYQGDWAKKYAELTAHLGGNISLADLRDYEAQWLKPLRSTYRGYEFATTAGRTYGGLWNVLAFNALENWSPNLYESHYSESSLDLELLIRLARIVDNEGWIYDINELDSLTLSDERLKKEHGKVLWEKVLSSKQTTTKSKNGSHSYHVLVADKEGNVITGTNTINSFPWGDGYFVEGIAIPHSGKIANNLFYGSPGSRRISPFSMKIVFINGKPRFATGAFNGSLITADMQFLINLIDYNTNAQNAVSLPRFGFSHFDSELNGLKTLLSPRISKDVVNDLQKNNIYVQQTPFHEEATVVDTGYGGVLVIGENGSIRGDYVHLQND